MQATFCKLKDTDICFNRQNGFTLLELLVVVVIIAILFTYTTLAIRSDTPEEIIKKEAQRMERLIQLALEEAILRGEEYGIEIFLDGYRFLRFDIAENKWLPLSDDKILRQRELPLEMELEMNLEDTEIVIEMASDPMSEQELDLDLETDNDDSDEDEKARPQIFLLSSGEITPEFDVRFYILGIEDSYFVKGSFDGTLTTEISDL
ncbi:MAG: type II secretion system minor pseudopilin GspH [Gammaproteobacteria bacterium]|nr:type II secretion system minor pseudopilin GspH [Gammaproteobacteria bacterium]NNJ50945.1 type II secretion system minor pseudopilin GspH [Gammaproteobacteria bacterium]